MARIDDDQKIGKKIECLLRLYTIYNGTKVCSFLHEFNNVLHNFALQNTSYRGVSSRGLAI